MNSNNKKRLLYLLEILIKNTDEDHHLALNEIVSYLEENDININDRKTIYDDIKILNDFGYDIEYNNKGYYLSEAPFTLSELKILIDSVNSLKSLDKNFVNILKNKLYSFTSYNNETLLKHLEYSNNHKTNSFIHRLEDTLEAFKTNSMIIIKRKDKESEMICPLFLHRNNDYYYLYYCYENNTNIYHTRFDNILTITLSNKLNQTNVSLEKIYKVINESTNSFHSKDTQLVEFKIINDSNYLRDRLKDDFSNCIFTKDGFSIITSISDVFFAKLVSYGSEIKIANSKISDDYIKFLKKIIKVNTKQ